MSQANNQKEIGIHAVGMWKGLVEAEWTKDDLIDLGKSLFSKKTLKSLLEGSKRDKEIFTMINRNFARAVGVMLNYVEEQRVKVEAAITAAAAAAAANATATDNAKPEDASQPGEK